MTPNKFISIEGIAKRFPAAGGAITTVFEDLWLSMQRGEFTCIIGHSGCGKTTVLNILAGLDQPSAGTVIVDNQAIEGPSLDRAVIFQTHALLPWRTVMGNVSYAVSSKWRNWKTARVRERAQKFIDLVGLNGAESKRPAELSGGMKQRVGNCARAFDRAEDHADGRAVLGARCAHARNAAGRSQTHLPGDRANRVHDHARCGRGDLSGRPDCADDQRPRRGAGRDRREPAAEGARAHRCAPPSPLLCACAITSSISW